MIVSIQKCFAGLLCALSLVNVLSSNAIGQNQEEKEEEKIFSLSSQIDFNSAYVSRAQDSFDGAVIQPSLTAEYNFGSLGTTGANFWSSFGADDNYPAEERFSELDYTLYHNMDISALTLGVGHTWYTYPWDPDYNSATQEWYASISLKDEFINPSLTYFRDYKKANANYLLAEISHDIEGGCLGENVTVTPFANAFFSYGSDGDYTHFEKDGLASIVIGTSASFSIGSVGVAPSLSYNFKVDDTSVNKLWLTISLSYDLI